MKLYLVCSSVAANVTASSMPWQTSFVIAPRWPPKRHVAAELLSLHQSYSFRPLLEHFFECNPEQAWHLVRLGGLRLTADDERRS